MPLPTLFISHSWQHSDAYEDLVRRFDEAGLRYHDRSVPRDHPIHNAPTHDLLLAGLRERIEASDVVLVIAGMYYHWSEWIEAELALANSQLRKPLIAVVPENAERVPAAVREAATRLVPWETGQIVGAIHELVREA